MGSLAKRRFKLIISSCLLLLSFSLNAKELIVDQIKDNGLPSEYVTHIEQLSNGFLLFSTQTGSRLYDGKRFIEVVFQSNTEISPLNTHVYHTLEDSNNNIWFATAQGLYQLPKGSKELIHIERSPDGESQLINNNVRRILEDSKGNLWFGTLNGISQYQVKTRQFKNFTALTSTSENDNLLGRIYYLIEHQNSLWIGSSKGLFTINIETSLLKRYPGLIGRSYVTSAMVSKENELWVGTDTNGLFNIDTTSGFVSQIKTTTESKLKLRSNNVWSLFEDQQGLIWIGYWNQGVTVYDPSNHEHYQIYSRLNELTTLPGASVESITKDNSGLIWIATTGGASFFNPANRKMHSIHHISNSKNRISNSALISTVKDQSGIVWIGSEDGIDKWNPITNKIENYYQFKLNGKEIDKIAIWKISNIDSERLLLAAERGVFIFHKNSGQLEEIPNLTDMNNEAVGYAFYSIKKINEEEYFALSSASTIHKINVNSKVSELVFDARQDPKTAETEYYASIIKDQKNRLWVGSTTGIHRINLDTQAVDVFSSANNELKLSANIIYDLEIKRNKIWAATSNGGINIIDLDSDETTVLTLGDGLPSNEILNLFSFDDKSMWFTTKNSAGYVELDPLRIIIDPLLSASSVTFAEDGVSITADGKILTVGNRVLEFNPQDIKQNNFTPPIVFSALYRLHKLENNFSPLTKTPSITLLPQDTLVSFEFASLDYAFSKLIKYRYKLKGYDKDWLFPGDKAFATYTHLPPGKFTLVVESTDRFGNWGGTQGLLEVTVIPPWWKSSPAYALYFILVVLIITIIAQQRRQKRNHELVTMEAIKQSESRMKDVLWGSGDELWRWNLPTNEVYTTAKFNLDERSSERTEKLEDVGKQIHPDDKSELKNKMNRHLAGETSYFEAQYRIMDSERHKWKWVLSRGRIVEHQGDGSPLMVAGTTKDIDDLKRTERQLRYLANYDQLTNLPNRSLFLEHLNHSIKLASRFKENLALLFLDLDGFKMINDTLGHSIGDQLLQSVAQRLQQALRGTDNLARLSGDEFAIIIERINSPEEVEPTVTRLIKELNQPFELANQSVATTVSIGIAMYPEHGESPAHLLKHADIAMYQAKRNGKKHFRFFHSSMNALLEKRIDMEQELKVAISEKQFQAYYQPRANVQNDHIMGFETLIRWFHPDKGMISPAEFIPVAEETGQILEIGEIILEKACRQASVWQKQGWKGMVSVNIAALQFQQSDLVGTVQKTLEETQLPPEYLELEITEGTLIKNVDHTRSVLLRLKELGIKVALDDFGTGYSSLSYLQQLPIDVLKIDRSFILEITHSNKAAQLSKAIINMAHSLGLTVVAEGIEEKSQLEFLKQSGCEEYQGFLFGRPVPADELFF